MEIKHYECSEEIKNVLISIEDLHVRRRLEHHFVDEETREVLLTDAKRRAEFDLADAVREFIKVETVSPIEVEATLYLPYIYDAVMERKDRELRTSREHNNSLTNKLKKLKGRTLWQRILNKDV